MPKELVQSVDHSCHLEKTLGTYWRHSFAFKAPTLIPKLPMASRCSKQGVVQFLKIVSAQCVTIPSRNFNIILFKMTFPGKSRVVQNKSTYGPAQFAIIVSLSLS